MLPTKFRIKGSKAIPFVLKSSFKSRGQFGTLILKVSKSTDFGIQFGVIASKKVGNAVARNLYRRRVYAVFSELLEEHLEGLRNEIPNSEISFVYIVFTNQGSFKNVSTEIKKQFNYLTKNINASNFAHHN